MVPSLFMISQMTSEGWRAASLAKSTAASVCPARAGTPAFFARNGKDVTRTDQIGRPCRRINCGEHGGGAIGGRNSCGCTLLRLDADAKSGFKSRAVVRDHEWNFERIEMLGCHRQANQSAAILRHEIDDLRRNLLSGDSEVTFVFAIFIVDNDHHLARAYRRNRILNACE